MLNDSVMGDQKPTGYTSPEVTEYGSVEAITEQPVNKEGTIEDNFTPATDGVVVGSTQPAP